MTRAGEAKTPSWAPAAAVRIVYFRSVGCAVQASQTVKPSDDQNLAVGQQCGCMKPPRMLHGTRHSPACTQCFRVCQLRQSNREPQRDAQRNMAAGEPTSTCL